VKDLIVCNKIRKSLLQNLLIQELDLFLTSLFPANKTSALHHFNYPMAFKLMDCYL
jgi:hypothetical protein